MGNVRIILERMIYFSFDLFHHIPNVSGSLPQASHNKFGEFWPIPPDRAGVTESGL
jgi:hypothetical protein